MTTTLEHPLNGCDCSAEQITMLTNAEAPTKIKKKVVFFHSTRLRKAQKKSPWGWRVSS